MHCHICISVPIPLGASARLTLDAIDTSYTKAFRKDYHLAGLPRPFSSYRHQFSRIPQATYPQRLPRMSHWLVERSVIISFGILLLSLRLEMEESLQAIYLVHESWMVRDLMFPPTIDHGPNYFRPLGFPHALSRCVTYISVDHTYLIIENRWWRGQGPFVSVHFARDHGRDSETRRCSYLNPPD